MKKLMFEKFKRNPEKPLRLHPEYGLNPTILEYICPISGKTWESNEIALLGWNKGKEAPMKSLVGYKICPEVQTILDKGYIALIVTDETKTTNPTEPYRTGEIDYIRESVFEKIMNVPKPEHGFAYIGLDVHDQLKEMADKASKE